MAIILDHQSYGAECRGCIIALERGDGCLASSIFSLGDNDFSRCLTSIVTGGNERERVEAVLLRERRGGGKVGNLVLVLHFSIRFVVGLWECGNRAAISKDCGKRVVLSISP